MLSRTERENKTFYCIGRERVCWSVDVGTSRRVRIMGKMVIMGKSLKKKLFGANLKHLLDSGNDDSI